MKDFSRLVFVVLIACSIAIKPALAQTTSGQISGRIVDPDGRSIVNAEVTLTNQFTSEKRMEKTDASGDFVFASVQPGTFILSVTAPGFKGYTKKDVVLSASERLSAGTMRLETGAVEQSVQVTADATPVQTESGERSALLDEHQVANLLNPARNVMQLNRILPGVVATNAVGSDQLGIFGIDAVNGVRSEYNSASVDGIMGNVRGRDQIETPLNMDAVSEVKILTNNYQAEYGGTSGTPINMVTKAGTRDFHGSVYYFKRHEEFNANQFFNSKFWNQDNNKNPIEVQKPQNRFNTIGYKIGGPVWIPKVNFNRSRDKLFFFFSQEIWPTVHPGDGNPLTMTVPTALERQGDFSQSFDNSGKKVTLKDPKNCGAAGNANCLLDPTHINTAFINPNIQKLLGLLPLPNTDPTSQLANYKYNYQVNLTEKNPVNQRVLRVDYNISDKWHAYFRGLDMNVSSEGNAAAFIPMQWLSSLPVNYKNHSPNVTFDVTYIANPTLINEFSVGYAGWSEQQVLPNGASELAAVQKSALGVNLGQFRPQLNPLGLMPTLTFSGGISNAPTFGLSGSGGRFPINSQASSYDITDGLTKVWHSHVSKTGIYLHFDRFVQLHAAGSFTGTYDFSESSNPLGTGDTFATALLGNFKQYMESTAAPDSDPTTRIFDWYVQDNWKMVKNFTLDYGLRFTWDLPQKLHAGANFVPALYDPAQTPVLYRPAVVGGKSVGQDPRNPAVTVPAQLIGAVIPGSGNPFDGLVPITNTNIIRTQGALVAPRIGFAWDILGDGKTVLRGGAGIFYNSRPPASQAGDLTTNPPVQSNGITPSGNASQLLTAGIANVIFPSNLTRTLQGHGNRPVFYNSSLGIQRRIGFQTVIDIAYVGTLGRHLGQQIDLNALPPGIRFQSTSLDSTGKLLADNFLRHYIGLGSIPFVEFEGTSNYNALQIQATRRFTRGLEFGANYTWSKALDFTDTTTAGVANFAPIHAYNYGLAGFDRDHAFKINWLWDVPKGSHLWDNPLMRAVFDNWQFSGIASFIRGQPRGLTLSPSSSFDVTGGGDGARVLLLGNPALGSGDRSRLRYFNTDLVTAPSKNTVGANGQYSSFVGNAGKVVFRGPGTDNWDLALYKNIPIKERATFQFRCEFYNAFNHPSFNNVDTSAQFKYNSAGIPGQQLNTTLGQVDSELGPRQIQFSARFSF